MAPPIMNGISILGLRSIVKLISVVDIVDSVVVIEESVAVSVSFLNSPMTNGAARSGPNIVPTPYMNCENCRIAGLLCCHISMSQILLALSQAPAPV